MNWLFYKKETEDRAKVMLVYSVKPPEEMINAGNYITMEVVPEPEIRADKIGLPYCNPITKEFWYDYVDKPLTEEEINSKKLNELEGTIMELTTIIAQLQGGN